MPATGESTVALDAGQAYGVIPPFAAEERDLGHVGLSGRWAPAPGVIITARYAVLRAVFDDGTVATGSGDLKLGTAARAWTGTRSAPEVWLWWEAKLPNASDFEGSSPRDNVYGLGTDETDVTVGAGLRWDLEPVTVDAVAGLAILGDPFSFANQDDAAVAWLSAAAPLGPAEVLARVGGRFPSPDNEPSFEGALGAEVAPMPQVPGLSAGLQVTAGITHAAPDVAVALWIGHRWRPEPAE